MNLNKVIPRYFSEKGLTLIEILASITILSFLITSFLAMFIQSAQTNHFSESKMNATYTAEAAMEEMSNLVTSAASLNNLAVPAGYSTADCPTCYDKSVPGHFIYIKVYEKHPGDGLASVLVIVYHNSSKTKLEAQMENLLSWKD